MSERRALHLVHGEREASGASGHAARVAAGQARLLACYEGVAHATRRMLDAARAYDWTSLRECGRDCEAWMQRIEAMPAPEAMLDAKGRQRRLELLAQVLRDDARLRDLLDPALGRVARCLGAPHATPQA